MRLTVVGCSGTVPGPTSPASCYLLEADDADGRTWRLLLDLGSGALGALQKYCDPREIDAVALSHLHLDHVADVAGLHTYLSHHPGAVVPGRGPVAVYGPAGTPSRLEQLRGKDGPSAVLAVQAWPSGGSVEVGPFSIGVESVPHSVPAFAMRIEGPSDLPARARAVIAYSGDCAPSVGLAAIVRDAEVFLCEASFLEGAGAPPGVHLTAADAGRAAAASGCGRLVLTHLPPWADPAAALAEAGTHYTGRLEVASQGMRIVL